MVAVQCTADQVYCAPQCATVCDTNMLLQVLCQSADAVLCSVECVDLGPAGHSEGGVDDLLHSWGLSSGGMSTWSLRALPDVLYLSAGHCFVTFSVTH